MKNRGDLNLFLLEINKSISNRRKQYKIDEINTIFYQNNHNSRGNYAIKTLFLEVDIDTMIKYIRLNSIPLTKLQNLYNYYKNSIKGKKNEQLEWLFS